MKHRKRGNVQPFLALLAKNFILLKRGWVGTLAIIAGPLIFIGLLVVLIQAFKPVRYGERFYVDTNSMVYTSGPSTIRPSLLKNCSQTKNSPWGTIAIGPSSSPVMSKVKTKLESIGYKTKTFETNQQIDAYVQSPKYGQILYPTLCFGAIISKQKPYELSLRYNISIDSGPTTLLPDQDIAYKGSNIIRPSVDGMLNFQNLILNYIGQVEVGSLFQEFRGAVASTTIPASIDNSEAWTRSKDVADPMVILPLIGIYLHMVSTLLSEKQSRIKQTMKIMGLKTFNYYSTWFIAYFIIFQITNLCQTGIFIVGMPNISYALLWLLLTLFSILLIIQGFFIQVFFSKSKIGIIAATIFFALQYLISFIFKVAYRRTYALAIYVSIVPHAALSIAIQEMTYSTSVHYHLGFQNVYELIYQTKLIIAFISISTHICVWLVLFMYLEEVIPNEWGLKRHPCFFLECFRKKKRNSLNMDASQNSSALPDDTVRLTNVVKQFHTRKSTKVAVNDLSLTLVTDEVFVLLGHNGAGKSTTIGMMTGMQVPTSGQIKIFGYDAVEDVDEIRKLTGVCFQYNTLYQNMTVEENLTLFGMLKGCSYKKVKKQINSLLYHIHLTKQRHKFIKELSGGQQRRVCVAVAFIGGSKLVYLDEPTSGMDTAARRHVWQILKNYKTDRVIILTTHFMDEAQLVADRIGIMANGSMRRLDDPFSLKKGFGYSLTIVKEHIQINSGIIVAYIRQFVPQFISYSDISLEISVQMHTNFKANFSALLQNLDGYKRQLGIASYRISQSSLEEVFLTVIKQSHYDEQEQQRNRQITQFLPQDTRRSGKSWRHFKATILKRMIFMKRDITGVVMEFALPWVIILLAMIIIKSLYLEPEKYRILDGSVYGQNPWTLPLSGNTSLQKMSKLTLINNGLNYPSSEASFTVTPNASYFNNYTLNFMKYGHGGIFFVNQTFYIAIVNTTSINSALIFNSIATQTLLNFQSPQKRIQVKSINRPFKPAYGQDLVVNYLYGALFSLAALLAVSLRFSSTAFFIVKQKHDRCKFQQQVSGMNLNAYWLGNFLYDYLAYILAALPLMILFYIFGITLYTEGEPVKAMWILTVIYGLANIPFTYLFSHIFNDFGFAQVFTYDFNIFVGTLLPLFVIAMRISQPKLSDTFQGIAWIFRVFPSYCYGQTIINIAYINLMNYFQRYMLGKPQYTSIFVFPCVLSALVSLSWQIFAYTIILLVIEKLAESRKFMKFVKCQRSFAYQPIPGNLDVTTERQLAMNSDLFAGPPIIVKGMGKVYKRCCKKKSVAVKDITFTVSSGHVFGLLGVNGAGKTTMFKMLTSQVNPTQGNAYFKGLNVNDQLQDVRKIIGYCPQFDALLEKLTVRQQLSHYYQMKNLPKEMKKKVVEQIMSELRLTQFENALSGNLSGGNKRRLSLACAIMGNPQILLLDEPSTGMDPQGRRFMWKIISQLGPQKKNSSVILTTHSMDEADALSTRLGIMLGGLFHCVGTPPEIKAKYKWGCQVQIKIENPTDTDILVFLHQHQIIEKYLTAKDIQELELLLLKFGYTEEAIKHFLSDDGPAQYMKAQLEQQIAVPIYQVAQFTLIEQRGRRLQEFMQALCDNSFFSFDKEWSLIEHFDTYFTYRLTTHIPAWKIFNYIETNRKNQKISEYWIRQVSLQPIFNELAINSNNENPRAG